MKAMALDAGPHPHIRNVVMSGRQTGPADNSREVYNPALRIKIQRLR